MGIFDDFKMGFGLKEKDQDYYDRTAATIERNEGSGAADRYRDRTSAARASAAGSTSTSSRDSSPRPVLRPTGANNTPFVVTDDDGNKSVNPNLVYAPGTTKAMLNPASTRDPYVDMTAGERFVAQAANVLSPMGMAKKGLNFLAGVKDTDRVMGTVDGKPIYQRENGTYYTYNALGLPYDTAGPDTLDEDPAQIAKRERMMGGMGSDDDDGPMGMPDIGEGGTGEEDFVDPCPEGYKYDEEQKMCVVDVSFVPDLPEVDPTPLLPTEVGGNYTQMPGGVPALPPLNPYPQMQGGLGATNLGPRSEGILQVVAGPQAPRGPAPIPSLTMPQMPPQRRA